MPLISDELLQQLIDAAYGLAVTVHCEDVPEEGVEASVVEALRRAKREIGVEPKHYVFYGDVHEIMGEPPSQPRPEPAHVPETKAYYQMDHIEVNDFIRIHLGVPDYNCAEREGWDSDHIEFVTVDLKCYHETDRQMLQQFLADPPHYGLPLSLVLWELADRNLIPEGDYMIWVV